MDERLITRLRSIARVSLAAAVLATLAGCEQGIADLEQYVAEVKARKPRGIEPIPEIKPYQRFDYVTHGKRDPFDSSVIAAPMAQGRKPSNPDLSPDPNRSPEFLEGFPLDTLRVVGTLEQRGTLWGLVKTPEKSIQRVKQGNYIGQNYGKIERISDAGIDLTEIIPDGFGGWRERETFVALSEQE